jgi:hypothetical protein
MSHMPTIIAIALPQLREHLRCKSRAEPSREMTNQVTEAKTCNEEVVAEWLIRRTVETCAQ